MRTMAALLRPDWKEHTRLKRFLPFWARPPAERRLSLTVGLLLQRALAQAFLEVRNLWEALSAVKGLDRTDLQMRSTNH